MRIIANTKIADGKKSLWYLDLFVLTDRNFCPIGVSSATHLSMLLTNNIWIFFSMNMIYTIKMKNRVFSEYTQ